MNYWEHVYETFIEHHNCMGMDMEECHDLWDEASPYQAEKWLTKIGYDLKGDWLLNEQE